MAGTIFTAIRKKRRMEDKSKQVSQENTRINVYEEHELQYWSQKLAVSKGKLRNAVAVVGATVAAVEAYLKLGY